MNETILAGMIGTMIVSATPILYAALGEIVGERAGMVNLGVDGLMLVGAAVGFVFTSLTGNPFIGLAVGALAAAAFNLIYGVLVVTLRTNQLATGLTLWFFALGVTSLIGRSYVGTQIDGLGQIEPPGILDNAIFRQDILVYLVVPAAILVWWVLYYTRWGLRMRMVGEDQTAAFAAGLRPRLLQYQALLVAGLFAGIGGAELSLAYTTTWTDNMTAGRGFIAITIVMFALWHPFRAILGALLFGGAVAVNLQLQASGSTISPFLLDTLPYLLTLAVVLAIARSRAFVVPAGLKEVFEGTAR